MRVRVASSLSNSWTKEPIEAVDSSGPALLPMPDRHYANRSLSTAEPVSAPPKRKLENGERRPAPETRTQRMEMPEIVRQRPAPASLSRGNINDFYRPGKISPETELRGWGTWIRTKIDGVRVRCSTVELSPTRSPQKAKTLAEAWSSCWCRNCQRLPPAILSFRPPPYDAVAAVPFSGLAGSHR
jgi:hypothetical protein